MQALTQHTFAGAAPSSSSFFTTFDLLTAHHINAWCDIPRTNWALSHAVGCNEFGQPYAFPMDVWLQRFQQDLIESPECEWVKVIFSVPEVDEVPSVYVPTELTLARWMEDEEDVRNEKNNIDIISWEILEHTLRAANWTRCIVTESHDAPKPATPHRETASGIQCIPTERALSLPPLDKRAIGTGAFVQATCDTGEEIRRRLYLNAGCYTALPYPVRTSDTQLFLHHLQDWLADLDSSNLVVCREVKISFGQDVMSPGRTKDVYLRTSNQIEDGTEVAEERTVVYWEEFQYMLQEFESVACEELGRAIERLQIALDPARCLSDDGPAE